MVLANPNNICTEALPESPHMYGMCGTVLCSVLAPRFTVRAGQIHVQYMYGSCITNSIRRKV